jgi:hypothetical protein
VKHKIPPVRQQQRVPSDRHGRHLTLISFNCTLIRTLGRFRCICSSFSKLFLIALRSFPTEHGGSNKKNGKVPARGNMSKCHWCTTAIHSELRTHFCLFFCSSEEPIAWKSLPDDCQLSLACPCWYSPRAPLPFRLPPSVPDP